MELADTTRIEAPRLRERLEALRRRPRPQRSEARSARRSPRRDDEPLPDEPPPGGADEDPPVGVPRFAPIRDGVETETIRLVIHQPEVAFRCSTR